MSRLCPYDVLLSLLNIVCKLSWLVRYSSYDEKVILTLWTSLCPAVFDIPALVAALCTSVTADPFGLCRQVLTSFGPRLLACPDLVSAMAAALSSSPWIVNGVWSTLGPSALAHPELVNALALKLKTAGEFGFTDVLVPLQGEWVNHPAVLTVICGLLPKHRGAVSAVASLGPAALECEGLMARIFATEPFKEYGALGPGLVDAPQFTPWLQSHLAKSVWAGGLLKAVAAAIVERGQWPQWIEFGLQHRSASVLSAFAGMVLPCLSICL